MYEVILKNDEKIEINSNYVMFEEDMYYFYNKQNQDDLYNPVEIINKDNVSRIINKNEVNEDGNK